MEVENRHFALCILTVDP